MPTHPIDPSREPDPTDHEEVTWTVLEPSARNLGAHRGGGQLRFKPKAPGNVQAPRIPAVAEEAPHKDIEAGT